MARSAEATARILTKLFDKHFGQDYSEPFRITWPQLRTLAGVPRLDDPFLKGINGSLSEFGQTLIPLDNSLLIAGEYDFEHFRAVPDMILEEYLPDGTEGAIDDGDQELEDADT